MFDIPQTPFSPNILAFLASTDLFRDLDKSVLHEICIGLQHVRISGGETLISEGELGDCAHILVNGRLRVFVKDQNGKEVIAGEVARGEIVGEMALLTNTVRSATVRAVRDCELVKLSKDVFDRLFGKHPQAMIQMTRQIIGRIQRRNLRADFQRAVTIAIVPTAPGEPVHSVFASHLSEAISRLDPTVHLNSEQVDAYLGHGASQKADGPNTNKILSYLHAQESQNQFVIYESDATVSNWTRRCLKQADRVLIVGLGDSHHAPQQIEVEMQRHSLKTFARKELVLLHENGRDWPRGTHDWRAAWGVDGHYHIRLDSRSDFERLARLLTGRAVGTVLSGGGARGLAHIGVIRAIQESGIPIDIIGGTSMGSVISALHAMGLDYKSMYQICKTLFVNQGSLLDLTFPVVSLAAGARISRGLAKIFGDLCIEDLWIKYYCVSSNLTRAEEVVHREGLIWKSIRASLSLPGVLPPVSHNGDLLVDGGVMNNLPVDVMRTFCDRGTVLACDVRPKVDLTLKEPLGEELSGWRILGRLINPFSKKTAVPQMRSILMRATLLASIMADNLRSQQADLCLCPPVEKFGLFNFEAIEQIAETAYKYSLERLEEWSAAKTSVGPSIPAWRTDIDFIVPS